MITMLHVLETLEGHGGTPRKLLYLAQHINRHHAKLVFAHFRPSPLAEEFIKCGCDVHYLNTESPLTLTWQIQRVAWQCRADIICTHFTRSLLTGFVVAKLNHIPIVHNEHSSAHYRQGLGRVLTWFVLPWVNLIICNSHHTRQSIQQSFPGTKSKLVTIHNPVEERIARRSRQEVRAVLRVANHEVLIVHVGRMIPERDQLTLIQAFGQLRRAISCVRLLMIGEGPCRANLELHVKANSLEDAIVFIGNRTDIGDYLQSADIYVNPTLDEGFGIAVVEAMLSGIPVVLSDCGAHPELIIHGQSGFLYPGGDSQALAVQLNLLVHNPELRKRMGVEGRRHAQHHFAPHRYSTRYLESVQARANGSES